MTNDWDILSASTEVLLDYDPDEDFGFLTELDDSSSHSVEDLQSQVKDNYGFLDHFNRETTHGSHTITPVASFEAPIEERQCSSEVPRFVGTPSPVAEEEESAFSFYPSTNSENTKPLPSLFRPYEPLPIQRQTTDGMFLNPVLGGSRPVLESYPRVPPFSYSHEYPGYPKWIPRGIESYQANLQYVQPFPASQHYARPAPEFPHCPSIEREEVPQQRELTTPIAVDTPPTGVQKVIRISFLPLKENSTPQPELPQLNDPQPIPTISQPKPQKRRIGELYEDMVDELLSDPTEKLTEPAPKRNKQQRKKILPPTIPGQFYCEPCNKNFSRPSSLKQHRNVHHSGPRPFRCDQCGKKFPAEAQLRDHLPTHGSERSFRCLVAGCGRQFYGRQSLNRHVNTCHALGGFQCPNCPRRFVRNDHLKNHLICHLNGTVKKNYK